MDTFCVLPWYNEEIYDFTTPCCLLPHNHNIEEIKKGNYNFKGIGYNQ